MYRWPIQTREPRVKEVDHGPCCNRSGIQKIASMRAQQRRKFVEERRLETTRLKELLAKKAKSRMVVETCAEAFALPGLIRFIQGSRPRLDALPLLLRLGVADGCSLTPWRDDQSDHPGARLRVQLVRVLLNGRVRAGRTLGSRLSSHSLVSGVGSGPYPSGSFFGSQEGAVRLLVGTGTARPLIFLS